MAKNTGKQTVEALKRLSRRTFAVSPTVFLRAVKSSPNARGYIHGAIAEILVRKELRAKGYTLERIKEKWVGKKLHRGDFYVKRGRSGWFVLETKGLKSNAEKFAKIRRAPAAPHELEKWFMRKKGELRDWWDSLSNGRRKRILASGSFRQGRIFATHLVSTKGGKSGRRVATPLRKEFHVLALDLKFRTGRHEFIYTRTRDLKSQKGRPEHLKQNYLIDIVVPGVDGRPAIHLPWTWNFDRVFKRLKRPVAERSRQVDLRGPGMREAGVDVEEAGT